MTRSTATTQISCQVEAPIDYPVQQQGYSSRIQKINFDTSNSSGRRYCLHKNPQNNSSIAEERSRTDSFKSRPHNRTSSFQKNKTPTLIPVPLLDKAKPFLGNKRLDDTGKYNDPNLSNHQNSAKIYGKDSDRCSSMYCSSRMPYLKRSFYQKYFTHDTSIDMPCCYSSELVNSSTNFLAADGIFHEKYQRSITKISISMQKSDSSPSLQSDSGKFPSLAISLKEEKNRIKSRTNTLPRNSQPQSFINWQYAIHGNISVGTQYPFINPSARFEYRSQIPKLNPSGKKGFVHSSVSHESVVIKSELDSRKMVQTKAQTYDAKTLTKEAESLFPTISSKNRQIYTTQPNSFWCGRFTALHDRFHNDMLETLVIDRKTYTRFQDGTLPSSRTVSTLNSDSPETTAGLQYLNDEETRRCKKSFIHLGALCVTDEAKKSLWNFQLAYARSQGKKQLLPIGGQMDPDVNQEREI